MSGYSYVSSDLDLLLEPIKPGDPKHTELVGAADGRDIDATDRYAPLTIGAKLLYDTGYLSKTVDFRNIFAAIGSVPRYGVFPWERTITSGAISFYRQSSRTMTTTVDVICRILPTGHAEIQLIKPNVHSHPTNKTYETIFAVTGDPAWDDSIVPAGVDYEIKFDVTSGGGYTLNGGLALGAWHRLASAGSGVTLKGSLSYTHNTTGPGVKTANSTIAISVRRADYPDTNKSTNVMTLKLSATVLDELFSPVTNWARVISVVNNRDNRHNPDRYSATFTTDIKASFNSNGILTYSTRVQNSAWTSSLTTRWRRADIETSATDFDVKCTARSGGGGTLTNPIASWTQVTGEKVISYRHSVRDDSSVGNHYASQGLTFSIRQRSTRGWAGLADNQVMGNFDFSSRITIIAPPPFPWPDMSSWDGQTSTSRVAALLPETPNRVIEYIAATFKPDGTVTITDSLSTRVPLASGVWLPSTVSASEVEVSATLSASGTAPANDTNDLSSWTTITANKVIRLISVREFVEGIGTSGRRYSGSVSFRRKDYPSDVKTVPLDLIVDTTFKESSAPVWTGMSLASLTDRLAINQDPLTPTKYETATVRYSMGMSSSSTELHVRGQRKVHGSTNPVTYEDIVAKNRIVPVGWSPSDFEWRARKVGGTGSINNAGVWRGMKTAAYSVDLGCSINHGSGVGLHESYVDLAIDVRRVAYPSHSHTFYTTLKAEVEFLAPSKTFYPPANFLQWEGVYSKDFVVVIESPTDNAEWIRVFEGLARGESADYIFEFRPDGVWKWYEVGAGNWVQGRWLPTNESNGSLYDISFYTAHTPAWSSTSNISASKQTMGTVRKYTISASLPPEGELDNYRYASIPIQITKRSTGAIHAKGILELHVSSWR